MVLIQIEIDNTIISHPQHNKFDTWNAQILQEYILCIEVKQKKTKMQLALHVLYRVGLENAISWLVLQCACHVWFFRY